MSIEEAEQLWMAWQVGLLRDEDKPKLAEAILTIKAHDKQHEQNV